MRRALLAGVALLALLRAPAAAQQASPADGLPAGLCERIRGLHAPALATPLDELHRLAEISGCESGSNRLIRRGGVPVERFTNGVFHAVVLPSSLSAVHRSGYADDRNNGALWEGVGVSSALRAGVHVRAPIVTLSLQPEILFHQNADFDHRIAPRPGFSPYASPFYTTIDLPTRFGEDSWTEIVPGDSYIRADYAGVGVGASTESLWRGPAVRYPILMSNTAGGFPHVFLSTSRGLDVFIGDAHAELLWGRLEESDYFDSVDNDESRLVNLALALDVRWLPGLSLGFTRSYQYRPDPGDGFGPVLETIGLAATENRAGNEIASLFGRWVFPASGAEVYAEWSRDDVIGEWDEFFQEPDHAQGYMFGFQKVTALHRALALRVHGEIVHLQEKGEDRSDSRPIVVYYTHHEVQQGYTHRGQLLGAGVGPGGDGQFLAVDALFDDLQVGAYYERIRRNDFTDEAFSLRRFSPFYHDAEIMGGIRAAFMRGPLTISGDLRHALRYKREFRGDDRSWRTELRVGWTPDLELAR